VPVYPEIEPYRRGRLRVSEVHELYFEESGNPKGKPVVFLHGGPGGGTEARHRRFFDPNGYRIVLFDQRGCGRSTPHASIVDNTTWHLVDDMERLRRHLGIERWQVFGGSWGSTLALAYAQKHPQSVSELVLRGIFTFAEDEVEWFYRVGTRVFYPDAYAEFTGFLPVHERECLLRAYAERIAGHDREQQRLAARAWSQWECRVASLIPDAGLIDMCNDLRFTLAFARIESHYFRHKGFFDRDQQLLDSLVRIVDIPAAIVHGRYDVICPVRNAWRLHARLPRSSLTIVEAAGHSANEPAIADALIRCTDAFVG
jgi:proline iminopeptidase